MKKKYFIKAMLMLLLSIGANAIHGQDIKVVDINKIKNSYPRNDEYSQKNTYAFFNGFSYFTADDGIHGSELWRSDGTGAGTTLVKDVNPGTASSNVGDYNITASGEKLYFAGYDEINGKELWVSDGTEAGTHLLADLYPGNQSSNPQYLTDINGVLFFFISYQELPTYYFYHQLWKTDGTAAGTVMISDFNYGFNLQQMINVNGRAFFTFNSYYSGQELFTSDGTPGGTYMVADINPYPYVSSRPTRLTAANGLLYFAADDGSGGKLWVSDGTTFGTHPVNNIYNINLPVTGDRYRDTFAISNNVLYFQGFTFTEGYELCKYDLSAIDPTVMFVKDILPGDNSSYPSFITNTGDKLFFTIGPAGGDAQLWKTDGTEAGTVLVKTINPGGNNYYYGLTNVDGYIMFAYSNNELGFELWKSDGTATGTILVKDIAPGIFNSYPQYITYDNGVFLFGADDQVKGFELWKSDGTSAGTKLVKNINQTTTSSSYPYGFTATANNKVVFGAQNKNNGNALWVTDGSVSGTRLLKNISPYLFTKFQNKIYFIAFDNTGLHLWKTNGTVAGTSVLAIPDFTENNSVGIINIIATDNLLYIFTYNFYTGQITLWRTDGTAAGTYVVLSNIPNFYSLNLCAVGNTLFFTNYDVVNGFELWKTDGSIAGTKLVKDIYPGLYSSSPINLFNFNGKLYFVAYDGGPLYGNGFWSSDGTEAGTKLVKAILVGYPPFAQANGKLFFYAQNPVSKGFELFASDGTASGTRLVKDIFPGPASSNINSLISGDTLVYFLADNGTSGQELWKSNGTKAGTKLVKDISPDNNSSIIYSMVSGENKLFFIYNSVLWQTDGTRNGTSPVNDVNLQGVTNIFNLTAIDGNLYFSGNAYPVGDELFIGNIAALFNPGQTFTKSALYNSPTDEFAVKLITNPVLDQVKFTVTVKKQQLAQVRIIDAAGRILVSDKKWLGAGSTVLSYNSNTWTPGIYLVNILTSENYSHLLKAVK